MLKENIDKVIQSLKEAEDFYTTKTGEDAETNSTTWDVSYQPDLKSLKQDIYNVVKGLESVQRKFETNETETLLKIARSLRNRFSRLEKKHSSIKEQSGTSQGGASMEAGSGAQYATPRAFTPKTKKKTSNGYKIVPSKIKGSGLEVKKLYEGEYNDFQKGRIDIFEQIEKELNDLPPLISNAKNKTVEYYSSNPGSYAIINSTDLILEYIKDIKTLLKGEQWRP